MGGRQNGPPTSPMPLSDIEKTKLDQRKAASDAVMAERHREFDLSSKDNHFKYERAHFAVVMSSPEYRENYDKIDWSK